MQQSVELMEQPLGQSVARKEGRIRTTDAARWISWSLRMSGPQYLEDGFGVDLTAIAIRSFETVLFSYGSGVWGFRFRGLGPSGFSGFGLIIRVHYYRV